MSSEKNNKNFNCLHFIAVDSSLKYRSIKRFIYLFFWLRKRYYWSALFFFNVFVFLSNIKLIIIIRRKSTESEIETNLIKKEQIQIKFECERHK